LTTPPSSELSVRSESVQRLYNLYLADRFEVNRRYQRKLVWAVGEKQRLIDSMLKDMPIPLFLVAEIGAAGELMYELIDGMQRFNAIFSFLENEYPLSSGEYFNLDALADTKLLKDEGRLRKNSPILARGTSVRLANYTIALSAYRAATSASVDEVFRRINSGGRRLSKQELRQAGTISPLSDLVRVVSSRIRTDTSPSDNVPLKAMPKLSITSKDLPYGVLVDEIFWVREGVLRREEVRQSADEQLVLDMLIDCIVDPMPSTGTRIRDAFYDFTEYSDDESPTAESKQVANAVEVYGAKELEEHFLYTYDEIRQVLSQQDRRFSGLIEAGSGGRSARYFHAVFMAFYELMFKDGMRIKSYQGAADLLTGVGKNALSVPPGGGDWNRDPKRTSINAVKGVIRPAFEESGDHVDQSRFGWASQLETLLSNALVEQQLFECKQGFYSLGPTRVFDEASFAKICCTLTAMANVGSGAVGHLIIGIVDSEPDAKRVLTLDKVEAATYRHFQIVGIEREAALKGRSINDYWTWLNQKLKSAPWDAAFGRAIASESKLVPYRDRMVGIFRVTGGSEPVFFNDALYERLGSETQEVPKSDYMRVFGRFVGRSNP